VVANNCTKDVDKIVNYWTDDAFLMQEGQPPLKGKQAIRQMVEESFKIPGFSISWQPQSVEVSDNGDMAYMIENAQVSFTDSTGKAITINNKAVTVWRKQAMAHGKMRLIFQQPIHHKTNKIILLSPLLMFLITTHQFGSR
jgi:ketosteroid isomerase-like protein